MASALSQPSGDYRITIASKRYRPTELTVAVQGLPASAFQISAATIKLETAGQTGVMLSISPDLARGVHPVVVEVRARDGWVGQFKIQHLAG
jgi:hypothetical protein